MTLFGNDKIYYKHIINIRIMKKMTFMAIAMGLFAFTACQQTKKEAPAAEPVVEVITDSATQQKVAGEYKSADGKRIITINSDFTVKTTGLDKDFFKWEFMVKPENSTVNINLVRKGLDAEVKDQAVIDAEEGSLLLKNETFRKAAETK
jgi:hypothetical protein